MSPRVVNWIYTAVVKPILLYGVVLCWTALHKQFILTLLTKVQRMAALCISGVLRTTPNKALNAILNLPSLDLASMERAKWAAIRLRSVYYQPNMGSWSPGYRRQLHSGRVRQAGHHHASPPRKGECRHANGNLQAKYKKII